MCKITDQRWCIFPAENDTEFTREVKRLAAATANSSRLKIRIHRQTLEQLSAEVRLKGIPERGSSVDKVVEPKEEREFQ